MNDLKKHATLMLVSPKQSDKVQISIRITRLEFAALQRRAQKFSLTVTEIIREYARGLQEFQEQPQTPVESPPKPVTSSKPSQKHRG